jgi:acyl-CoA dehydrogenase
MDSLLQDTVTRILADFSEQPEKLWPAIEENGIPLAWVPESTGGFGLPCEDGFEIIRLAGAAAAAVPLAETLMATWLLSAAGVAPPVGPLTVALGGHLSDGQLDGRFVAVPFAPSATIVCLTNDGHVAVFTAPETRQAMTLGLDPAADFNAAGLKPDAIGRAPAWLTQEAARCFGALVRSAQICGAMEAVLEMTVAFVSQREQFGRPISKFQAIQAHLTTMAAELAAASAATQAAVEAIGSDGAPDLMTAASAKARAGEAANIVAAAAHQAHGAIGYAWEYRLGAYTRRMLQWRNDFGDEFFWARRLGELFLGARGSFMEKTMGAVDG